MLSRLITLGSAGEFSRMTWMPAAARAGPRPAAPRADDAPKPEPLEAVFQASMAAFEREAERKIAQSREEGYREGLATGAAQAESAVHGALERLVTGIAALADERTRAIEQAESDMIALAVEIARRVLHRELTVDTGAVEALVKAAVEKLQTQERTALRVHPEHVAPVRGFLERMGKAAQIDVVADPGQEPGGLVFDLSTGQLDASIETQLREIERGLADRCQR